jgi:hypothetical protein
VTTMRAVSDKHSNDEIRKHLEESKRLGREMDRAADGVVRHLRRAAELLRQADATATRP